MRLGHNLLSSTAANVELSLFLIFGGDSGEVTPVPIPNTEVKLSSADGTTWVTVWESRTLPEFFKPFFGFSKKGFFLEIIEFFLPNSR